MQQVKVFMKTVTIQLGTKDDESIFQRLTTWMIQNGSNVFEIIENTNCELTAKCIEDAAKIRKMQ